MGEVISCPTRVLQDWGLSRIEKKVIDHAELYIDDGYYTPIK